MRTNSKSLPQRLLDLGNGKYHINYNVVQSEDENGDPEFNYDTAVVNGEPNYNNTVAAILADRYSLPDEMAMINNFLAGEDIEEYQEYQHYRRRAKAVAGADTLMTAEDYEAIL